MWLAALVALAQASSATPLLDYANGLDFDTPPHEAQYRTDIERAAQELASHPPPAQDCARTLGASRFTQLLEQLAVARAMLGDHAGAIDAYEKALGCAPRAAVLHARLAEELLDAGRLDEALATLNRGLAIAHDNYQLGTVMGRVEFLKEHWAGAIGWLRWSVQTATTLAAKDQALYWQCLLWLAQRRSGIAHPHLLDASPPEDWPGPILDMLQGASSEEQLLAAVQAESDALRRREILCEALYYVGEQRLANGEAEQARRYFAATANLKVVYFIEHSMALAELAKMRAAVSKTSP
jgi:tetratricopeptide (TPR) repeat protein